jgi:hypothetical protein
MTFTSIVNARRRRSDGSLVALFVLLAAVIFAGLLALRAWALMILIGVLHAETGLPPRTVGFWISVPIAILLGFLFTPGTSARTES